MGFSVEQWDEMKKRFVESPRHSADHGIALMWAKELYEQLEALKSSYELRMQYSGQRIAELEKQVEIVAAERDSLVMN